MSRSSDEIRQDILELVAEYFQARHTPKPFNQGLVGACLRRVFDALSFSSWWTQVWIFG